ncbi:MAG: tetratricopeptide repeat protein [Clostridia bacterium]|nr:tetratricopeptide repeat protein [Clostridia bacterium]
MDNGYLKPEDYAEPRCLLCDEPYGAKPEVRSVPQGRIIEKMNDYMSRRDYKGAERHLLYWLNEAMLGKDTGGELMIRNELIGHYRKTGNRDGAFMNSEKALALLDELQLHGTKSAGITYINIATAYNAFGENEKSLEIFVRAKATLEALENPDTSLLGGLYNNMALTCAALGRYEEALCFYEKALGCMEKVPGGELECAITYLNMADTYEASLGSEAAEGKISDLLDKAAELFDSPNVTHNGYYAFVCEKCAPSFSYYGYFAKAQELNRKAKEIYERD